MDTAMAIQELFNWIIYFWTLPIYITMGIYVCGCDLINKIIQQIWLFLETGSPTPTVLVSYENRLSGPPLPAGLSPGLKRVAQFTK